MKSGRGRNIGKKFRKRKRLLSDSRDFLNNTAEIKVYK